MSNDQTTSTAAVVNVLLSNNRAEETRACFKRLHHVIMQHVSDTKDARVLAKHEIPAKFEECGRTAYKSIAVVAQGLLSAKEDAEEKARLTAQLDGIAALRTTYNNAQRAEKKEYDAMVASVPEKFRKSIAPFPSTFTVPGTEVAKLWPEGTPASTIALDLVGSEDKPSALKKALSYDVGKGGSLIFSFVPEPKPVPKPEQAEPIAQAS